MKRVNQKAVAATREGAIAGAKAAAITCVLASVPTLYAVRNIPWAKANINYTGQALFISGASIFAYFVTADKALLATARKNTHYDKRASAPRSSI